MHTKTMQSKYVLIMHMNIFLYGYNKKNKCEKKGK